MTHEKHFNHVLVTALFTDNEPQRTSELYRNHDYPIYEHKLQAYPRMPLFPSMVVREKSEGDTTKRDGITKYIKALSEKLEPFTVQLGDEVVIGGDQSVTHDELERLHRVKEYCASDMKLGI